MHYILEGHTPVVEPNLLKWAYWFEVSDRTVARTKFSDVTVSTVFQGLDYVLTREGPPLLFETMIFEGPHDGYQQRYSTWDEAEVGHLEAVKIAQSKGENHNV